MDTNINPNFFHISNTIRSRIEGKGKTYFSNDNISEFINDGEMELLMLEAEEKAEALLKSLVIDIESDHNTQDSAKRITKMFFEEIFRGRYEAKPRVTNFPNVNKLDQLYISGPISIRSTCSHHFQPIRGQAWVGIFPSENVIGLSKFNRLIDWVASRPQIQEEMTLQIAELIENETDAAGTAVIVKAEHLCITQRGVREHESKMTTSEMRGVFRTDPKLKSEFMILLNS